MNCELGWPFYKIFITSRLHQTHDTPLWLGRQPQTPTKGQARPTKTHSTQRQPTKANTGPQQPTEGQCRPTKAHSTRRRPTQAHEGPQHPTTAHVGQRRLRKPTQASPPRPRQTFIGFFFPLHIAQSSLFTNLCYY